jgi:hypothetical protein
MIQGANKYWSKEKILRKKKSRDDQKSLGMKNKGQIPWKK